MEIDSLDIHAIRRLKDGRKVLIDDDVQGVAAALKQIDPNFRLRYSESAERFVVYALEEDGSETLITTAKELDGRVAEEVAKIAHKNRQPGYSYAKELERIEAERRKEFQDKMDEQTGIYAERISHAIRHDLKKGRPGPIYADPDWYR